MWLQRPRAAVSPWLTKPGPCSITAELVKLFTSAFSQPCCRGHCLISLSAVIPAERWLNWGSWLELRKTQRRLQTAAEGWSGLQKHSLDFNPQPKWGGQLQKLFRKTTLEQLRQVQLKEGNICAAIWFWLHLLSKTQQKELRNNEGWTPNLPSFQGN